MHLMHPSSCDTMVALGSVTAQGQTLFAKNSDRPADANSTITGAAIDAFGGTNPLFV